LSELSNLTSKQLILGINVLSARVKEIISMQIGFLIYKWKFVNPKTDSVLRVIRALIKNEAEVYLIYQDHLDYTQSTAKVFKINGQKIDDIYAFFETVYLAEETIDLNTLDCLVYSNVPPLDTTLIDYLYTLNGPKIINSLKGLSKVRFKDYVQELLPSDSDFIPKTCYTRSEFEAIEFIESHPDQKQWILKPNMGSGGNDVVLINSNKSFWLKELTDYFAQQEDIVVVQEFLKAVAKGDTRILLLDGKPIGAMKRIPGEIHYLTNCSKGGRAIKHEITETEFAICQAVKKQLKKDGILFCGIDIIGDKLIEVNGLSPGGIGRINYLHNMEVEIPIVDRIMRMV